MDAQATDSIPSTRSRFWQFILKILKEVFNKKVGQMLVAWLITGIVTGLLIIGITLGAMVIFGPKPGQVIGILLTIVLTIIVSDISLRDYVKMREGGPRTGFAKFAEQLILPMVDRKSKRHGQKARFVKTTFLAYTAASLSSGAIVTQGISYEVFERKPTRARTIWGGLLFASKLGILWAAVALAVYSGGDFWENWWGAWW